jgi:transposase-like protein
MLMEKGYHKGQKLTMSELGLSLEELAGQPLELFAREGARLLLTVALEEEATTACENLARHLDECLTFYQFPERHWRHIRTSNVIERSFKEVKRRTRVIGRFPNETSALVIVFSLLEEEKLKWQKVRMRVKDIAWIEEASKALDQQPIKLEFLEEVLVA